LAEKPVYVAPRNEIEQKLVTIWEQTLELDRVGIHDDFSGSAAIRCSQRG